MKYLSVCAGIEAATCAWHHMGWEPVAFSEIEKFPSAVLAHHYPNVPNWGDMTKYKEWPDANIDVLVGGTPCQSFSVAGLRKGLDDPRGNLMLTYLAIAKRYRPEWLVWENVPGVLSSAGGRDFAALLRGLDELGYGWAYRVLDAQYFGVAQRRRRVFVVGHLGNWQRAAAVLFERHSLSGHPAPSRQARKGTAGSATPSVAGSLDTECGGGKLSHQSINSGHIFAVDAFNQTDTGHLSKTVAARNDQDTASLVAGCWWDGGDLAPTLTKQNANGAQRMPDKDNFGAVLQPITFGAQMSVPQTDVDMVQTLQAKNPMAVAQPIPYDLYQITAPVNRQNRKPGDPCHTLARDNAAHAAVAIQGTLIGRGENAGPQGSGADVSGAMFTLTKTDVHAVATLSESLYNQGISQGDANACSQKTNAGTLLRVLHDEIGEEAFTQWGLGILNSLQSSEILQQALHGLSIRPAAFSRRWVVYCSLSREESRAKGVLQSLREAGCQRCASQGWQPSEQFLGELGAYLSELSLPGTQATRFLHDLWQAAKGAGVLQQALLAIQNVGRPVGVQAQSAQSVMQVRRLTAEEAEFLQGFPRGYTNIPWRGKPESPDGSRYKALGNSMAVPVMSWIGERINEVSKL